MEEHSGSRAEEETYRKIDMETLRKEGIELSDEEIRSILKERKLRRIVFRTIVQLSDTVDEKSLLQKLNYLDVGSWMEVVEERYLGRICGFPLCSNTVELKPVQKYRLDIKNKMIFERSSESQKFCSNECYLRSMHVQSQLTTEPLWIRGDTEKKHFSLDRISRRVTDTKKNIAPTIEFVKESIVTKLSELKIGDSADTDDEKEASDDETRIIEDEFPVPFQPTKPLSGTATPALSAVEMELGKPAKNSLSTVQKAACSPEEKIALIRQRNLARKAKWRPALIDPKPMSIGGSLNSTNKSTFANLITFASEWCGPETISFLRLRGRTESAGNFDLKPADKLALQFYLGERIEKEVDIKGIILPRVDNFDQISGRRFAFSQILKPRWQQLEKSLKLQGCRQRSQPLIATFSLTATNVALERAEAHVAVAFVFRLMAHCDDELLHEYFPDGHVCTALSDFLNSVGCEVFIFTRLVGEILRKL